LNRRNLLLKMELRSNPEALCVVRGAVAQLTERLGFSEPECRAWCSGRRSADEYHSSRVRRPPRPAHRSTFPLHSGFLMREKWGSARDRAEGPRQEVDRAKLCGRALEDVKPGGLGLHFIRESMDALEFRRRVCRNQLRLVKFLPKPIPRRVPEENEQCRFLRVTWTR